MEQKFSNLVGVMEAANHSKNSAMEAENHVKQVEESLKSQMSRGDFLKACFALSLAPTAMMIGCGGGSGSSGSRGSAKIKMTTEKGGNFGISLAGSGTATVDWGDGSEKITLTLKEIPSDLIYGSRVGAWFEHTYQSATIRTITINGDNITALNCMSSELTSLDVSKNTALEYLAVVESQLTNLDLSKNTALSSLKFDLCGLSTAALNALFGTLHGNTIPNQQKTISINDNPGTNTCDPSIAERKGWRVLK